MSERISHVATEISASKKPLLFGSLFAGIGGFDRGLERVGMRCLWQVEINPFRRAVLAKHWPNVRRFVDVHFVSTQNLEPVDLICGGFPCQDLSPAGKRAGLAGHRSGLWREFRRIVGELRPRFVVIENSGHAWRSWVPFVRRDLFALRYPSVPIRVRASDLGALHERARIFVVADAAGIFGNTRAPGAPPEGARRAISPRGAAAPNTDRRARQPQSEGRKPGERRWACDGVRWEPEPDVARVVHGLSEGLDRGDRAVREAALGDSVCPPIVEWIGARIVEALSLENECDAFAKSIP